MSLTNHEASIVLGMIARGDKQHDIAAWFGENQARIVEVENGAHGNIPIAPCDTLPPRGAPGPKGRRLKGYVNKAINSLENQETDAAMELLREGIARYDANET